MCLLLTSLTWVVVAVSYYLNRHEVTYEMQDVSKVRFALMSLLDALHSIFVSVSVGILPAPVAIMLPQVGLMQPSSIFNWIVSFDD
jgi:uncharacterized membrane protein YesL